MSRRDPKARRRALAYAARARASALVALVARQRAGRLPRREFVYLGLSLALLVALYVWGARSWLDTVDEGYFAYTSSRVLAGELPYRDFATPYTPGFFYLNALLFKVFGRDLMPMRVALCLVRGGILLLLYVLGRRIMPPAFALVPLLIFVGQDHGPTLLEVHPAWYALLFALLAVWCAVRHLEQPRAAWLVAAGLAAGASFAFKQNAGLFTLLALCGLQLARGLGRTDYLPPAWLATCRALPGRLGAGLLQLAPAVYFLALLAVVAEVTRPHLELRAAALLFAPLVGLAGLLTTEHLALARSASRAKASVELAALLWRLQALSLGFLVLTLTWLIPLAVALGPSQTPLGAFFGQVDQSGYVYPLRYLRLESLLLLMVLALVPFALWRLARPRPFRTRALEVVLLVAAFALLAGFIARRAVASYRAPGLDLLWLGVDVTSGLVLYLPALAFWPAWLMLARRAVPRDHRPYLRWYVLAGGLLLLTQYPRMDETHLIFSAPLLWLPGAYVLSRLAPRLLAAAPAFHGRPLGRALAFAALLCLPLVAVWPSVDARLDEITGREAGGIQLAERTFVPVGIAGASVMADEGQVRPLRATVTYIQAHTEPNERIFVYPAAPLLYYLADRHNATRFSHVLPGLLSDEDETAAIRVLGERPPALVVWDAPAALEAGEAYRRLTDFIWERYEVRLTAAQYVVLAPRAGALAPCGPLVTSAVLVTEASQCRHPGPLVSPP